MNFDSSYREVTGSNPCPAHKRYSVAGVAYSPVPNKRGGQLQILGFVATPRQIFGPQTVIRIQKN